MALAADTRTLLLEHGCRLFSRRGYDAVGVQELVDAVGVTKPSLYHWFGHKRGLLAAIAQHYGRPLRAVLGTAADYRGDLPLTLDHLALALVHFARQEPDFYRLLLSLWFAPPENEARAEFLPLVGDISMRVVAVFESAHVQHGNMKGRHQAYGTAFLGLVHTMVGLELGGGEVLDDHEIRRMVGWFQHGIYS